MNGTNVLLKKRIKLLQTFEIFEKFAKIKIIKTFFMNSSDVLVKNSDKYKNIIAAFTRKLSKSNAVFLPLRTLEILDKMAKIKTIKIIPMNRSDVLPKTSTNTKILLQPSHGNL